MIIKLFLEFLDCFYEFLIVLQSQVKCEKYLITVKLPIEICVIGRDKLCFIKKKSDFYHSFSNEIEQTLEN